MITAIDCNSVIIHVVLYACLSGIFLGVLFVVVILQGKCRQGGSTE